MNQIDNKPVTEVEPIKEKKQGIFIPSLKIGLVLGAINTFIDGLRIWNETPSQAYIISLGGGAGETGLLAYRISMLIGAAIPNLILWFVLALVLMFVLRQLKKA